MKKIVCIMLVLAAFAGALFAAAPGETAYVSVQKTEVKSGSGAFAKTVSTLSYGDEVKITKVEGKWYRIQLPGGSENLGWIPAASVTGRKIIAQGKNKATASADEIALAGKGFSAQVEDEYKHNNSKVNYAAVDALEAFTIKSSAQREFISDGKLNGVSDE